MKINFHQFNLFDFHCNQYLKKINLRGKINYDYNEALLNRLRYAIHFFAAF
jgi:hypothetical protein